MAPVDQRDPAGVPLTIAVNYVAPHLLLRRLAEAFPQHAARYVVLGAEPAGSANLPVDVDDFTYQGVDLLFPDDDLRAFALYGLATAPELEGITGRYFANREEVETAAHTTAAGRLARLWAATALRVGLPA
jgi:hypothetical protein